MLIVVSRSSVIPASRWPEIDDPMISSLVDATVAGPYMYFTVTSPMITKGFISFMMTCNMYWVVLTFSFCYHNSCSSFRAETWRIITLHLDPIAHCASHYNIMRNVSNEGTITISYNEKQIPSSLMLRSVGMQSCDMFTTSQISDVKSSRSFALTLAECPTSQIICFADSRATCNTIIKGLSSKK